MQMSFVRLEDGLSVAVAAQNGKGRVHNRQSQGHRRHNQRNGRRAFDSAEDCNRRQHVPDEHAARVPHKNGSRIKIIMDEPENTAGQRRRHGRHRIVSLMHRHQDDGDGSDAGHTGRQPVQAVDQIDYINKADDPENRKGDRQILQIEVTAQGIVQPLDLNIKGHQDTGSQNLSQQLHLGRQGILVIQYAHDHDPGAPQQDPHQIPCNGQTADHRENTAKKNGQPSQSGHNVRMHFSFVRFIHCPDGKSQFLNVRCQQKTG